MVSSSSLLNLSQLATALLLLLVSQSPHGVVQAQTDTTTITADQLAACSAGMFEVDVDNDSRVNRAEYINLINHISPFTFNCPDTGNVANFLGTATFSVLFEDLACLCLEHPVFGIDNTDCCTGSRNQFLAVPGVYPASYTEQVCTTILETIDLECSTSAPSLTPAPSAQPSTATPTVSRSPSADPSSTPSLAPSLLPSAVPSIQEAVVVVDIIPTLDLPPDPEVIPTDDKNRNADNKEEEDDDDDLKMILIYAGAGAGGALLLLVCVFILCRRRRQCGLRVHQQQKTRAPEQASASSIPAKAANTERKSSRGRSVAAGNEDHTGYTEMEDDNDNENDRDSEYDFDEDGFGQELVFDDDDDSSFPKSGGALLVGSYDEDDVGTMQDEEQGIEVGTAPAAGQGSSNHQDDDANYSFPAASSLSSNDDIFSDEDRNSLMGGIEKSDDDDDEDYAAKNKTVGPLTWKQGDDDEDDDDDEESMSTDDESGNDTITSLVGAGDDKDSESIEKSYTSSEGKGSKLSSREIAINTIIEQSKNGAEWFEFNLPSDDDDDNDNADTSDDDDLGLNPADAAALNALATKHARRCARSV
jgi:hypothetical protein